MAFVEDDHLESLIKKIETLDAAKEAAYDREETPSAELMQRWNAAKDAYDVYKRQLERANGIIEPDIIAFFSKK